MKLRPFDLEAAKKGAQVVTRDGKPARIICADLEGTIGGSLYPIAAALRIKDHEVTGRYQANGKVFPGADSGNDLFLVEDDVRTVYISTPVTSRPEKTMEDRIAGAKKRVDKLKKKLAEEYGDYVFVSTFDVNPDSERSEEKIMGRCIEAVLRCDAIFMDDGWRDSKGCSLEFKAAEIYGGKRFLPSFIDALKAGLKLWEENEAE